MDESLIVRRWRRYGADRLFVMGDTGARVGSVDLRSGEVTVDLPTLESGLRRAAQEFLRSDSEELVLRLPDIDLDDPGVDPGPVGTRLDRLTAYAWHVQHNVPMGRQGDVIEHLLIGPGGVYTVTVRSHPGSTVVVDTHVVRVDGRATSYVRDARLEARRARALLADAVGSQVVVRPVVVIEEAGELDLAPTTMPDDVLVLDGADVPGLFPRVPARLSADLIDRLAAAARARSTWAG
ncbi:NERD domain-containing protein [Cellulomonas sp. P24]|uniref:NERD domain-containing protein n=1 Tax=Cellulomonas sp. P24 TaxID=2885206 RepID=UPI00216B2964|nr:NERD domain-containing protein [Cellulomonas sp. P24]MCR6493247.1 NERD domain-containing protein [Cellulomonas sp. P24]